MTILNGTELLSIAHVEGRWALHSLTRTGQRTQIHSTAAGKAVLAFLSDDACADLLARVPLKRNTRRTIVKASAMKLELMRVRDLGYAVDDEEFEDGLRCVSAPSSITAATSSHRSAWRLPYSACEKSGCPRSPAWSWRRAGVVGRPGSSEPHETKRAPSPRAAASRPKSRRFT